ncbi:MAG: SDR family oxidoreductase [Acidimicrobiales bacterium]|jgi:NAD(P)-dependent dehydrogenase (short-subunit alcohol dehydrogenase family)|nr:SDR family oxidoreductase [Acidimicrobiales bacterium]
MGIAVVTGAGQGLGRATAERLARDGHHVVALDLDGERAAATAAAVDGDWRQCDVTDPDAVHAVAASLDGCQILVNNAGIWAFHSILEMSPDDARAVIEVNVLGVVWCTQAFAPLMKAGGGGSIVNLSSGAAYTNSPGLGTYPATKAAVESLTRTMALELGPSGIRTNAVGPGLIVSDGTAANYQGDRAAERAKGVPLGRVGTPADIADVIAFLCADDSRYVNGQVIYVDGGITAGRMPM